MITPELRESRHGNRICRQIHKLKKGWMLHLCMYLSLILAIAIVATKHSKCSRTMACEDEWIGLRKKCFYFSSDTKNWTASKRFCSSQGSELAHIDTREDMDFLRKHAGTSMHWIGLNRKQGESWKWTNGTIFNPWFEISGNGSFAFLNADGVRSSRGFIDIKWICSKPKF
ncbi:C-type lectin domain family 2 member A isoform X1 [Felis catus]|uniref:C-type lectin domain family 2 member A n=2 Tax=Felis catus TaxID=9685 RepID=A0ABI7ZTE7_FELCA|nr:C-type lectin domain family 2 member A isoform X1 [Felis catus]